QVLNLDPHYNPNLSLDGPSFQLAFPPRVAPPWSRSAGAVREGARSDIHTPDLGELRRLQPRGHLAVVLHLFDADLWGEMREAIARIHLPFDMFVSGTRGSSEHMRSA